MFKFYIFVTAILIAPGVSHAQDLQTFIPGFVAFLSSTFVAFLLGVAFLFFVINAVRFFIIQSNSEEGREKAKSLMTWSIIAFTLIIAFWGIVNLLAGSLGGLGGGNAPCGDYMLGKDPEGCTENYRDQDIEEIRDFPEYEPYSPINNPGGQLPG